MAAEYDSLVYEQITSGFIAPNVVGSRVNRSKGVLLAVVVIFAYLSWQLVVPFLQYVLGAVLIAFVLYPLQERLERVSSPGIAAFVLVVLAIVGFIVPFVLVALVVADDAADMVTSVDPQDLQIADLEGGSRRKSGSKST